MIKQIFVTRAYNDISSASVIVDVVLDNRHNWTHDSKTSSYSNAICDWSNIKLLYLKNIKFKTKKKQTFSRFYFQRYIVTYCFSRIWDKASHGSFYNDRKKTTHVIDASLPRHIYNASSVWLPQLCRFNSWENQRSGPGRSAQYPSLIRQLPTITSELFSLSFSVVLCLYSRMQLYGYCCNNNVCFAVSK